MRYVLAIFAPPLAVLACGRVFSGLIVSPILTACFWIPGMIHAWGVVSQTDALEKRGPIINIVNNAK